MIYIRLVQKWVFLTVVLRGLWILRFLEVRLLTPLYRGSGKQYVYRDFRALSVVQRDNFV